MAANAGETKVKLWEGICYPENMRDDWQDEIDDILQVPFAYAVHDIDHDQKSKQRKTHAHVIVVWGGNTTRKAIINVLNRLSADGKKSKRWKPLLQASQKASERSGRLEAMEVEKRSLEARLKALEGELATSQARLRTATAEQKALSEGCQRCEQGIANLQNDLTILEAE